MSEIITKIRSRSMQVTLFIVAIYMGLSCGTAFGHEWTIEGKLVKAKPVNASSSHVMLEDNFGNIKTVPFSELKASDLDHLRNFLSVWNSQSQQAYQERQIANQRFQFASQHFDTWRVDMVASNGQRGWRNYFANNSFDAQQMALREFPGVQIGSMQRVGRSSRSLNRRINVVAPLAIGLWLR